MKKPSHNIPAWQEKGAPHIWHPYTQAEIAPTPIAAAATQGSEIHLEDGTVLIDGIASWWSACHGYNHPAILSAMDTQLKTMPHVMFAGIAHAPAYTLAEKLSSIAPKGLSRAFFSDSGSVAIEVAMKMAVQYWKNQGNSQKNRFVSFRHGYHGDTMGAMSVGDQDGMHKIFTHYMPMQYTIDLPSDEYSFAEFDVLLGDLKKSIAGVIIEPLVQGAGGLKFHTPDVLAEIYRIAKKHGLLFIADEIMTGFGRTGMMFACNESGITPDILCLGKALTGGAISLGATLATEEIYGKFLSDKLENALMHGPTYMANPLACSAALASLTLFEKEPRLKQVEAIEAQLTEELLPLQKADKVVDVRIKGAIGAVQLEGLDYTKVLALRKQCLEKGVWLRPFGDVIYTTPAFTINPKELSQITKVIREVVHGL
ncbi:MAG: adenosylmethionine--8-amino-7-oxononanoate transaminase [Proteobacteria bacterium]|nr:adenosylmethionine--8-amino-7-oxononanoate transaminase [Pseudomonadota bacterium]